MEVNDVNPQNENVLVEVLKLDEVANGVYIGNQNAIESDAMPTEFYIGKVLKIGDRAADESQCPGLVQGDYAVFSQWSGVITPADDKYSKVIPGYNIVAISNSLDMNIDTITPTNDRILVELINDEKVKDGVFVDTKDDPRESVTQKGRVIRCGVNAHQYPEGTIVYFEPFDGNLIINRPDQQVKTLNSRSILFTI